MSHSDELGSPRSIEIATAGGAVTVDYRERGGEKGGRTVVFVHGLLVNGDLWRDVVPAVAAAGHRCIVPDWPFGAHTTPVPDADLTPPGVADLMAGFLAALDLTDVVLVANDTGGGMTQVLMSRHPERIGGVVLTPADSFERFPPPPLAPLPYLARVPGMVTAMVQGMRWRAMHYLPLTFGWTVKRRMPRELVASWLRPAQHDKRIRADLRRFLAGMNRRHTLAAAEALREFRAPVLLAWASEDKLFPIGLAHRLRDLLPDARLVEIADSYTFVARDQPTRLATEITSFLAREQAPTQAR